MARLINTTSMTVDGVIDVGDWFVAVGDHDDAARSLFETDDAAMLVGRKSFEGLPPTGRRRAARPENNTGDPVPGTNAISTGPALVSTPIMSIGPASHGPHS
jgi:hypothetical protein